MLWTENPRDPITENATDHDIINRAINDHSTKWKLSKLAIEMGPHYDFSEIPTVVYHGKKPVVYDGNRRIALGKIKHQIVQIDGTESLNLPDFPKKIPCNVCAKEIALENILRKHGDSGSWQPLERDIFLNKHMGEQKSTFLLIEESTNLISSNPHLNQRFVKEEIFRKDILKKLGFDVSNGKIYSRHNDAQAEAILSDISEKINDKKISTRKKRGRILEILEPSNREIIDINRKTKQHALDIDFSKENGIIGGARDSKRQPRRTKKKELSLFGGKLYIKVGIVGDLYRDISDLYQFYIKEKDNLSSSFPRIIRMSLRLLWEAAAKETNKEMDKYITNNFDRAKKTLDQDIKTTLANQNVTKKSIAQLLHTGAHNYQTAANMEQTIALSIIIGAIITITHGRGDDK